MLTDIDDAFWVGVEYPGFDVYLASIAGIVTPPCNEYGAFKDDPIYGDRMREHAEHLFDGDYGIDLLEQMWRGPDSDG